MELNGEWCSGSSTLCYALAVLNGVAERPAATMLHPYSHRYITRWLEPMYSYHCSMFYY